MKARSVLHHHEVAPLDAPDPQLADRLGGVLEEAGAVRRVRPGARHHPRALHGAHVGLEVLDQLVDRRGVDQPLLAQQGFERLGAQRGVVVGRSAHAFSR